MAVTSKAQANSQPKGLAGWRQQLLQVSLPAQARTGKLLTKAMQNPDCSLSDLEKIIGEDPVLAFQILAHANKVSANKENDVLSLPHAMSLMGMDKLRPLLKNTKYLALSPEKTAHNAFLQALSTSLHAASLAYTWAEKKIPGSGEGHYWMALRLGSVHWLLALASPKTYHAIELRVRKGESRSHVESDLMGCTLQQLTRAMLPYWRLSEFTTDNLSRLLNPSPRMLAALSHQAWTDTVAPEIPKAQGLFMQTPWYAATLAHWLALNSAVSWYTPQTLRTIRMVSAFLHQPFDDVVVAVHHEAVRFSREHDWPGVLCPAVRLLHPPLPRRSALNIPGKPVTPVKREAETGKGEDPRSRVRKDLSSDTRKKAELRPVRAPVPEKKAVKKKEPPLPLEEVQTALFKLFYLQTVKQQQVFSIHQLMDGASQVLHFDLGLTRCILFMKSRSKQGAVKGVYAKGFTDNSPFASMELEADADHLFGKLLNKPAAIWGHPEKAKLYAREMPAPLWQALEQPDEFMLATISIRGVTSGILYADNRDGDKELTRASYGTFRSLSQAINHGFGILASQKEKEQKKDQA